MLCDGDSDSVEQLLAAMARAGFVLNVLGVLLVTGFTWGLGPPAFGLSVDTGDAALPAWAVRPANATALCAALKWPCVIQ